MKKILIFTFAILCAAACMNEDDASDIILFVTPSSGVTAKSGEKVKFEIETWTRHGSLKSVDITSFDPINGSKELFSETNLSERYCEPFIYDIPAIDGNEMSVTLSFKVSDNKGHTTGKDVTVLIKNGGALLQEYSSITMYSAFSGKEDAFSLDGFKTMKNTAEENKGNVDIYMHVEQDADEDTFVPEWRSKTGLSFAKANDMEYSSITDSALNVFFNNSHKTGNVTNLAIDDIIIIGRENTALGVFKIILFQDDAGCATDRILFSFKPAV